MLRITPDQIDKRPGLIYLKIDGIRYRLIPWPSNVGRPTVERKSAWGDFPEAKYILDYCAKHFKRLPSSITSRRTKNGNQVRCRSITFAMLVKYSRCSLNAIGVKFECDHTTVLWGKDNAWKQYSKLEDWRNDIKLLDAHFEEAIFPLIK